MINLINKKMRNKYIRLTEKQTGKVFIYPTCTEMYKKYKGKHLKIKINSLWNALYSHNGSYENNEIIVQYKKKENIIWK